MIYAEVIGDPIGHSKSPMIHRHWLGQLGLDADYRATRVAPDDLGAFLRDRADDPDWRGCNVTVPHKVAALDHVADPGGVRQSIGAINTVFRTEDGTLAGTNTDAAGFWSPIAELDLAGQPVTVIGAGGAARAILWALSRVGVGPVTVMNRNVLKAAALLSQFGLKGQALPLGPAVPPAALTVNASSLGMTGQLPLVLDLSALPEDAIVYDIVYAPLETDLLAAARARGLETVDGLDMLVAQAAVAFEILFGQAPPRDRDEDLRAALTA
jgi:shikimate dehydrogenase